LPGVTSLVGVPWLIPRTGKAEGEGEGQVIRRGQESKKKDVTNWVRGLSTAGIRLFGAEIQAGRDRCFAPNFPVFGFKVGAYEEGKRSLEQVWVSTKRKGFQGFSDDRGRNVVVLPRTALTAQVDFLLKAN